MIFEFSFIIDLLGDDEDADGGPECFLRGDDILWANVLEICVDKDGNYSLEDV
jgi:hypothetical protein